MDRWRKGAIQAEEDFYGDDPMPLLKKIFSAPKKVTSARLYISGIGYYEAYINGKKVGDRVLEPGFTTYRKEVLYSTYDVTGPIESRE
jgi:alpha-L-rhamnosidase